MVRNHPPLCKCVVMSQPSGTSHLFLDCMTQILLRDAAAGTGHHPACHPAFSSTCSPPCPALVAAVTDPAHGTTATCLSPASSNQNSGLLFCTCWSFPAHKAQASLLARQVFTNPVLNLAVVGTTFKQYTMLNRLPTVPVTSLIKIKPY